MINSISSQNNDTTLFCGVFLCIKIGNDLHNFLLEIFKKYGIMIIAGRHNIPAKVPKQFQSIGLQ